MRRVNINTNITIRIKCNYLLKYYELLKLINYKYYGSILSVNTYVLFKFIINATFFFLIQVISCNVKYFFM